MNRNLANQSGAEFADPHIPSEEASTRAKNIKPEQVSSSRSASAAVQCSRIFWLPILPE